MLGCNIMLLRRDHMRGVEDAGVVDIRLTRIFVDTLFDLVTEMRDQARIGQAAASPNAQMV